MLRFSRFKVKTSPDFLDAYFFCQIVDSLKSRVSVQGVKSLGGHFACICQGVDFYEVKKVLLFFKQKYFHSFNHFYSEKSTNLQIYYDPQSARMNVQPPQGKSTPRRLALVTEPIYQAI